MLRLNSRLFNIRSNRLASNIIFNENNTTLKNLLKVSTLLKDSNDVVLVNYKSSSEPTSVELPTNSSKFSRVYEINGDNIKEPELVSSLLASVLQDNADVENVIFNTQTLSKSIFPRLAAQANVQPTNDIVKIIDENTFIKPTFAGNLLSKIEYSPSNKIKTKILSFRASNFPLDDAEEVITLENIAKTNDIPEEAKILESVPYNKFVENNIPDSTGRPDLTAAKVVVTGGRGLQNKENFEKMTSLLADSFVASKKYGNTKASIGATRAVVDAGHANNSLQIGQTGKIVQPELYIACGVSGAIQHLAGMKNSKVVVNINKEEGVPLEQISDYTLIADANEAIPELAKKISEL
ncbi:hypothetical protein FOG51_00461 [Hanseniaspora uvarum]|uniref:Probable electron transfer flavoprotein subunit alpha n=1 Tax=Hanseniaspora uvarum TaxID=29833 RepID=A0A1E5RD32_HANUV|nr:hypothetical protein FOG51_00461 [Hanseniaspora uvarum]KKA01800.1 putative electron transfer flavoprotein subunit alpha, mitochondrial [Hanseniaspora uvarum DSM 2768]OEJ84805.1 Electron transfer flavoprotein subunit alpha, mitochondrial [Hanseniaspora uvarum]GMM41377.1 Aim45 protein [Hanseniaspora uvarum]